MTVLWDHLQSYTVLFLNNRKCGMSSMWRAYDFTNWWSDAAFDLNLPSTSATEAALHYARIAIKIRKKIKCQTVVSKVRSTSTVLADKRCNTLFIRSPWAYFRSLQVCWQLEGKICSCCWRYLTHHHLRHHRIMTQPVSLFLYQTVINIHGPWASSFINM